LKITFIVIGSRGDLQPALALSIALQARGHEITLATHTPYEATIRARGVGFYDIGVDPQEILQQEMGQAWLETGRNPITIWTQLREMVRPQALELSQRCIDACADAEAILYSTLGFFAGPSIAEAKGIPSMGAYPQPVHPTNAIPTILSPWLFANTPLAAPYNQLTYSLQFHTMTMLFRSQVNMVRDIKLDLPPYRKSFAKMMRDPQYTGIYAYSEHVLPRPADWGDHLHISGYWFLPDDPDWQPPTDLTNFIANGTRPIYIGFGSMATRNPQATTEMIIEAVERAQVRVVLLRGWAGLGEGDLPDSIHVVQDVPHSWLFPQMAGVIHHGGAGTTAAGLRAGVPSQIIAHFADQPFWGRVINRIGVGLPHIMRSKLNVDNLTHALKTLGDSSTQYHESAKQLGQKIRQENGIEKAAQIIEATFQNA